MPMRTLWIFACGLLSVVSRPGLARAQEGFPLEEHTAASAAKVISGQQKPRMVVIYASSCVRSRAAFPEIMKIAERHAGKAAVLAFGVDRTNPPLLTFLKGRALPFPARWIRPWQRGELVAAFRPLGFTIGSSLEMPIIAVLAPDGRLVKQWSPALDLKEVEATLRSVE